MTTTPKEGEATASAATTEAPTAPAASASTSNSAPSTAKPEEGKEDKKPQAKPKSGKKEKTKEPKQGKTDESKEKKTEKGKDAKGFAVSKATKDNSLKRDFNFETASSDSYKYAATPRTNIDFIKRVNLSENIRKDEGYPTIIDVFHDQRAQLIEIANFVVANYVDFNQKCDSMTSPSTVTAYLMTLIHGRNLCVDLTQSSTPSASAIEFRNNAVRARYLNFIQGLKIPDFMIPILEKIQCNRLIEKPVFEVTSSYAGYHYDFDFPRFLPIGLFVRFHDLTSRLRANIDPLIVEDHWIKTRFTEDSPKTYGNVTGHYFFDGEQYYNYVNWHTENVRKCSGYNVLKAIAQRYAYAPVNIHPFTGQIENLNPYILGLHANDDDIESLINMLKSVERTMLNAKQISADSPTLCKFTEQEKRVGNLNHFYGGFALPTWHDELTTNYVIPQNTLFINDLSPTQFARKINFLVDPLKEPFNSEQSDRNKTKIPAGSKAMNKPTAEGEEQEKNVPYDFCDFPANGRYKFSYIVYSSEYNRNPTLVAYAPYRSASTTIDTALTSGLIIEFYEIDSFGIYQPNPRATLENLNSMMYQSAIPPNFIKPWHTYKFDNPTFAVERSIQQIDSQNICIDMHSMSIAISRRLQPNHGVAPGIDRFIGMNVGEEGNEPALALMPFNVVLDTPFISRMKTHFGYEVKDEHPPTPKHLLPVWSPYRIRDRPTQFLNPPYMLMDPKTIFGMDPLSVGCSAPASCLPCV